METNDSKIFNLDKLKQTQVSFEDSIKILERYIAENISNKNKVEAIKIDLKEANKKLNEALKYLNNLRGNLNLEDVENNIK